MKIVLKQRLASAGLYGVFLLLAIAAFSVTAGFPSPLLAGYPGSAMFPRIVLIAMGLVCVWGLTSVLLTPRGAIGKDIIEIPLTGFVAVMAMLAAFTFLLSFAGMEIAVLVTIGVTIWIRTRDMAIAATSAIGATIVVYVVFVQLLSVHLPLQFLPRYLLRL